MNIEFVAFRVQVHSGVPCVEVVHWCAPSVMKKGTPCESNWMHFCLAHVDKRDCLLTRALACRSVCLALLRVLG